MSTDHKTESVRRAQQQSSDPGRMAVALEAEGWTPPKPPPPEPKPIVSEDARIAFHAARPTTLESALRAAFRLILADNLKALPAGYDSSLWVAYAPGFYAHRADLYRALTGEEWPG